MAISETERENVPGRPGFWRAGAVSLARRPAQGLALSRHPSAPPFSLVSGLGEPLRMWGLEESLAVTGRLLALG